MNDDLGPITTRTAEHAKLGKIFLIQKIGCAGCIASDSKNEGRKERDKVLCHSLPPCGEDDGWADQDGYIRWVKERMT